MNVKTDILEEHKIIICIIARLKSTRLPNKVIKKIKNETIIEHLINKLKNIKHKNIEIALCTTVKEEDDQLEKIAIKNNIHCIRGSVLSVVDRLLEAATKTKADTIVRVTGDNIFTDPSLLEKLILEHLAENAEYSRIENIPVGVTAEVINHQVLKNCFEENNKEESEYMTLHLYQPKKYKVLVLLSEKSYEDINLSIDTPNDFSRTMNIFNYLEEAYSIVDVINIIKEHNIAYSKINTESNIKLIDKVITHKEYKQYLLQLRKESITKSIKI